MPSCFEVNVCTREIWGNSGGRWWCRTQGCLCLGHELCVEVRGGLHSQRTLKGPATAKAVGVDESLRVKYGLAAPSLYLTTFCLEAPRAHLLS